MKSGAPEPQLKFSHLWFSFASNHPAILKDINFQINLGEKVGVLGPSGSGKTTFLKLVAGLLVPTKGEIYFNETLIKRDKVKMSRAISKQIAMSFQKGGLLDCYNAWENIDFALAELTELPPQKRKDLAFQSLDDVGLSNVKNKKLNELSGGMLKRLSLARVFALRPSVLLLDDPTAGLDPVTSGEICSLIQKFCEAHKSIVLFSSSDLAVCFSLASKVVFLWNGEMSAGKTVTEFKNSQDPAIEQFNRGSLAGPLTDTHYA